MTVPSEKHFEHAVEFSRDALKALLIVNGGAATALIALMDKTQNSHDYTPSVLFFAAGAVSTVIASCFAYFSQLNYANHRMQREDGRHEEADKSYDNHHEWQIRALVAVAISILTMTGGIIIAALTVLPS